MLEQNQLITQAEQQSSSNQSVIQAINQSDVATQSKDSSSFITVRPPIEAQHENPSIDQSINQSIDRPTNQSNNESVNQPIIQSVIPTNNSQPIILATHQTVNQPINQSGNQSANQLAIQSNDQPISQSISSPANQSVIPSTNPTTNQPISKPKIGRRPVAVDDCCVCFIGESDEENPILFCDGPGCKCVVHQFCYGVDEIPAGDWLCDMCTIKADNSKAWAQSLLQFNECLLCPSTEGAFKPTVDGRWVHAACAIWTPETGFKDAEKVDMVIGVEAIERNRWKLVCDICHVKQGSCVQCMGSSCRFSFHVNCGWQAGLRMELLPIGQGDAMEVVKLVYCDRHHNEVFNPRRRAPSSIRLNVAVTDSEPHVAHPQSPSTYKCQHCGARSVGHECLGQRRSSHGNEVSDDDDDVDDDLQAVHEQFFRLETDGQRVSRQKRWAIERDIMEEAQAIVQVEQFGRATQDKYADSDDDLLASDGLDSDEKPKKKRKRVASTTPSTKARQPRKAPTEAETLKRKEARRKARLETNEKKAQLRTIEAMRAHSTQGKLNAAHHQRNQEIVANPNMYAAPLVAAAQTAIRQSTSIAVIGPQHRVPMTPRPDMHVTESNDPAELEKRVMLCISSEVPMVRKDTLKSLVVDCNNQQRLEIIARIFYQHDNGYGLFKLCEWAHEGLANSIFPYVTVIVEALAKLVRREWIGMPVLITSLMSIIQRAQQCLSPLVKTAMKHLHSRLVQIGAIQPANAPSTSSALDILIYGNQQPAAPRRVAPPQQQQQQQQRMYSLPRNNGNQVANVPAGRISSERSNGLNGHQVQRPGVTGSSSALQPTRQQPQQLYASQSHQRPVSSQQPTSSYPQADHAPSFQHQREFHPLVELQQSQFPPPADDMYYPNGYYGQTPPSTNGQSDGGDRHAAYYHQPPMQPSKPVDDPLSQLATLQSLIFEGKQSHPPASQQSHQMHHQRPLQQPTHQQYQQYPQHQQQQQEYQQQYPPPSQHYSQQQPASSGAAPPPPLDALKQFLQTLNQHQQTPSHK